MRPPAAEAGAPAGRHDLRVAPLSLCRQRRAAAPRRGQTRGAPAATGRRGGGGWLFVVESWLAGVTRRCPRHCCRRARSCNGSSGCGKRCGRQRGRSCERGVAAGQAGRARSEPVRSRRHRCRGGRGGQKRPDDAIRPACAARGVGGRGRGRAGSGPPAASARCDCAPILYADWLAGVGAAGGGGRGEGGGEGGGG